MALYEVLAQTFINDKMYDPAEAKDGEPLTVVYDGIPGDSLKPLDDAAKAAFLRRPSAEVKLARLRAAAMSENPDAWENFASQTGGA